MQPELQAILSPADQALLSLARSLVDQGYYFVTPTPNTHERVNARPGNEWADDVRGVFGWSRPFKAECVGPELLELMQAAGIVQTFQDGWRSTLRLSSMDDQVFWHSAYPTTAADAVFFGPDTYRFVRAIRRYLAQRRKPVGRAFDIGCGTGAGALAVTRHFPSCEAWGGDINEEALRLARVNAAIAGVDNFQTCLSNMLSGATGGFDLITANPPYLNDSLSRTYRHGGGSHGQELAVAMLDAALPRLAPKGALLLYTGTAFVDGMDTFLEAALPILDAMPAQWHWHYQEIDPDVFGEELEQPGYRDTERIAAVVLRVEAP